MQRLGRSLRALATRQLRTKQAREQDIRAGRREPQPHRAFRRLGRQEARADELAQHDARGAFGATDDVRGFTASELAASNTSWTRRLRLRRDRESAGRSDSAAIRACRFITRTRSARLAAVAGRRRLPSFAEADTRSAMTLASDSGYTSGKQGSMRDVASKVIGRDSQARFCRCFAWLR